MMHILYHIRKNIRHPEKAFGARAWIPVMVGS